VPRAFNFAVLLLAALAGCGSHDNSPAPPPARVPGRDEVRASEDARLAKPLPDQSREELPAPPFNDVPLVSQQAPETPKFVEAYHKVGSPRLLVWVAQDGQTPGYDEVAARAIDYAAMQTILTDWFSSGGAVAVISSQAARQALGAAAQNLDAGQNVNGKEVADRTRADVLISVRAQPTRQASGGPEVRLVAEASNLNGGESIGRAVVDVPPPLDKPQLNTYTRFLARKLMKDMTGSWTAFGTEAAPASQPR
jgi:hypothetical protein